MPFSHLQGNFAPTTLEAMRQAYDAACREVGVVTPNPLADRIAAKIIALAARGERDPNQLARKAMASLTSERKLFAPLD